MNRLVQIANAKLDAEEKELFLEQSVMAKEQVAMSDSLHAELLTKFQSILTPIIREELQLGEIYRTDAAPKFDGHFDWPLKQDFVPGSVVVFGRSEYPRAADGKIYVFSVAIVLTKAFGQNELHFWITNSYAGTRRVKLEEKELETQIGMILLERAGTVDLQFVKEKKPSNPVKTISTILAFVGWAAMLVGAGMMFYGVSAGDDILNNYLENGRTLAKFGFFENLAVIPFAFLGGMIEVKNRRS